MNQEQKWQIHQQRLNRAAMPRPHDSEHTMKHVTLFQLTLMLFVWRVVQPHGDEDEED